MNKMLETLKNQRYAFYGDGDGLFVVIPAVGKLGDKLRITTPSKNENVVTFMKTHGGQWLSGQWWVSIEHADDVHALMETEYKPILAMEAK